MSNVSSSGTTEKAIATAEASAALGIGEAELGYVLTKAALKESEAVAVFPLLALSASAIAEGISTYINQQAEWKAAMETVRTRFAAFEAQQSIGKVSRS